MRTKGRLFEWRRRYPAPFLLTQCWLSRAFLTCCSVLACACSAPWCPLYTGETAALGALCSLRPFGRRIVSEVTPAKHPTLPLLPVCSTRLPRGRLDPALPPPPFPRGLCSWKVPSQQLSSEWSQDTVLSRNLYLFSLEIPCAFVKL